MNNYIVVGQHSWNKKLFRFLQGALPGNWYYCETPEQYKFTAKLYPPRYVFFVHWSYLVPDWFVDLYECVCFHPTPLPYGRGGTPIQNMILAGHKDTTITAFKMTEEVDAGPIYYTAPMSLKGSLRDIFKREMNIIGQMISYIVNHEPVPEPQEGKVVYFTRRTPEQSEIPSTVSMEQLYDYIRMLDAPGYSPAKITLDNVNIEFSNARLVNGEVRATVVVRDKK